MKVGIIAYGMGNVGSVRRALEDLGAEVVVARHPAMLADVSRIVLPGVGAFGEAMGRLRTQGWHDSLRDQVLEGSKPLLGICLGMQLLATSSEENGHHEGLDLIGGEVRRLDTLGCCLRVPHVGWNDVSSTHASPLFEAVPEATDFYFVHSYAFQPAEADEIVAMTTYGVPVVAAVRRRNVFGTQFHPEKSSKAGRRVLRSFLDYVPC